MAGWDWVIDAGKDWFKEEGIDTLGQIIVGLIAKNPDMDYDKIIEMAIVQAKMNAPNIKTPSGQTSSTYNEQTGQFDVEQTYSPQVQQLYEMLVGNAGAPIDTYQNPSQMGNDMLGGLMNDRLTHMGLPQQEFSRRDFRSPGVTMNPFAEDDEDDDPVSQFNSGNYYDSLETGDVVLNERNLDKRPEDIFRQDFDSFIRQYNPSGGDIDMNAAINAYVNQKGDTLGPLGEFMVEHADEIGSLAGSATGITGLGTGLNKGIDWIVDNYYWGKGGTFQNPIPSDAPQPPPGMFDELLDEMVSNDPSTWDAQQSGRTAFNQSNRFDYGTGTRLVPINKRWTTDPLSKVPIPIKDKDDF